MSVLIVKGSAGARAQALAALNSAGFDAKLFDENLLNASLGDPREGESIASMWGRLANQSANETLDLIIVLGSVDFTQTASEPRSSKKTASANIGLNELGSLAEIGCLVCVTQQSIDAAQLLALMRIGVRDVCDELSQEVIAQWSRRFSGLNGGNNDMLSQTQRSREAQHFKDLQRDQRAGRHVQMGMLPPSPMAVDEYRLRHQIWPSLMLSGDFVDYFEISVGYFAFYVADVAGHGASSAFVTVLLKNFSRRLRREFVPSMLSEPGEILNWLNSELLDNGIDKHVAILCGTVNTATNRLELANAGHFPPAILIRSETAEFVEQASKPAGLFVDVDYHSKSIDLAAGDALMVVSDGLFEHMAGNDLAQHEQRILGAARQCENDSDKFWQLLGCDPETASADDITWFLLARDA